MKDLRVALRSLLARHGDELSDDVRAGLKDFVKKIAKHDRKSLDEVLRMLGGLDERPAPAAPVVTVERTVDALRSVLLDERAFSIAMADIAKQRRLTKAMLVDVYLRLYRRKSSLRASASREEIVQLIIDERNVLSRYDILDSLTRPEEVAAE